jgi:hypothetical protein
MVTHVIYGVFLGKNRPSIDDMVSSMCHLWRFTPFSALARRFIAAFTCREATFLKRTKLSKIARRAVTRGACPTNHPSHKPPTHSSRLRSPRRALASISYYASTGQNFSPGGNLFLRSPPGRHQQGCQGMARLPRFATARSTTPSPPRRLARRPVMPGNLAESRRVILVQQWNPRATVGRLKG